MPVSLDLSMAVSSVTKTDANNSRQIDHSSHNRCREKQEKRISNKKNYTHSPFFSFFCNFFLLPFFWDIFSPTALAAFVLTELNCHKSYSSIPSNRKEREREKKGRRKKKSFRNNPSRRRPYQSKVKWYLSNPITSAREEKGAFNYAA